MNENPDWKQQHSDEAAQALDNPLVTEVIDEFLRNMGGDKNSLPLTYYGLMKVAMYAGVVVLAYARGIDSEDLVLTREEQGVPIISVISPRSES